MGKYERVSAGTVSIGLLSIAQTLILCGYITYSSLDPGNHTLHHTGDSSVVGLSVYGFDDDNSYGYPKGMSFAQSKFFVLIF